MITPTELCATGAFPTLTETDSEAFQGSVFERTFPAGAFLFRGAVRRPSSEW